MTAMPPVKAYARTVAAADEARLVKEHLDLVKRIAWHLGRWQWRRTSRDAVVQAGSLNVAAGQPARIARRLGWGDYRLELTGAGGAKTVIRFASGWGAAAKDVDAPDRESVG